MTEPGQPMARVIMSIVLLSKWWVWVWVGVVGDNEYCSIIQVVGMGMGRGGG